MKLNQIFRFGLQLIYAKLFNQRIPFQISIRVTEQCNQNCTYCIDDYDRKGVPPPSKEQLFTLIDEFAELGTRHITLVGGEPLLRDDIVDIIQHIKKHNIHCSLTTNGRLINQRIEILQHLDLLSISLDGDRQEHDAYRGEGSHAAAIHALQLAREHNVPVLIICTVTNKTDHQLKYLINLIEKYHCRLTFEVLNPIFHKDGSITLRQEDMGKEAVNTLLEYWRNHSHPRIWASDSVLKYIQNWPFTYKTFRIFKKQIPDDFHPIRCYAGKYSVYVETNGNLVPCCLLRKDFQPTNAFAIGTKNAWKQMNQNECLTCRSIGCNMQNSLFSLDLRTIFNFLRTMRNHHH